MITRKRQHLHWKHAARTRSYTAFLGFNATKQNALCVVERAQVLLPDILSYVQKIIP